MPWFTDPFSSITHLTGAVLFFVFGVRLVHFAKRQSGVVAAWTTGVAYFTAAIFYQAATYSAHPQSSLAWIVGLSVTFAATIAGLRFWARRGVRQSETLDWAER